MIVLIDGDCSFCQWASKLLKRLCKPGLEISNLSQVAPSILEAWEADANWSVDSIKVISNGRMYIKSDAIAQVLKHGRWYAQPLRLVFLLPQKILDKGYDFIARNRKSITCDYSQNS